MEIDKIRFKVKSREGCWIYAGAVNDSDNDLCFGWDTGHFIVHNSMRVHQETICFYSGLNDSNGTPIYENDYISTFRTYDGSPIYEKTLIVYDKMQWFYTVDNHKYPLVTLANHGDGINIYVVGNKFDTEEQK